jgi:hypothetical protein
MNPMPPDYVFLGFGGPALSTSLATDGAILVLIGVVLLPWLLLVVGALLAPRDRSAAVQATVDPAPAPLREAA